MTREEPPRDPATTEEDAWGTPDSIAERLSDPSEIARVLDDETGRRFSRAGTAGLLLIPLGCAFVISFVVAIAIVSGVLALTGLTESRVAGLIGLAVALATAVTVVVVVFRALILRLPWLRRLVNR